MKVLKKDIRKGLIKIKVENKDDLWFTHRLIKQKDSVIATTTRKVKVGEDNVRKKILVKIEVDKNKLENGMLKLSGRILECNDEDIPLGNYQSIIIQEGDSLTIEKKEILKRDLDEVREATSPKYTILICAFDREEAIFYKLTKRGYEIISKIKGNAKKKDYSNQTSKNFFKDLWEEIKKYDEEIKPDSIIIASPGFWREYLLKEIKDDNVKKKIISATCNSVNETSIHEIMKRPETETALKNTRIKREEEEINDLLMQISKNEKAAYGIKEVEKALEYGAVRKILISSKFAEENPEKTNEITEKTEKQDGRVMIISSEFEPGKQLDGLGGVAALLRFNISQ